MNSIVKLARKGFTLIEVLVVVVIIGILASLILPRLLHQPERARIAEANQFLGVMRRAQINSVDTTGRTDYYPINVTPDAVEWAAIGLKVPQVPGALFTYRCTAGNFTTTLRTPDIASSCTAKRIKDLGNDGTDDEITISLNAGLFGCVGEYTVVSGDPTGCIVK